MRATEIYAMTESDARNYIREHYDNCDVREGDYDGNFALIVSDENGDDILIVIIDEASWIDAPIHDRIESTDAPDEDSLLSYLGEDTDSVSILNAYRLDTLTDIHEKVDGTLYRLLVNDEFEIAAIHYDGTDYLFTPYDWQAPGAGDFEGVEKWRVNDTEVMAVVADQLPRLAPWAPEDPDPARSTRIRIGDKLRESRNKKNLNIRDVAKHTGINKTTISNIEGGRRSASLDNLAKLCAEYGVLIDVVPYFDSPEAFGEYTKKLRDKC